MDILFSSAFLLLIVLLITQFVDRKHSKQLRNLAIFGIFVGIISIVYVSFFMTTVKMVAPIEININNTTAANLKIYAITFDRDAKDTIHREVLYDKEVAPSSASNFSIDSNGLGSLWVVAKNSRNEIIYLEVLNDLQNKIEVKVADNENINLPDAQTARELIFALDINKQVHNFAIWSNIILILLLIWSFFKLKKH